MRTVKVVQINIYKGRYLESLADFLIREKPDLVTLQEVSSGKVNLFSDTSINLFEYLKEKIGLFGFFSQDQKLKEERLDCPATRHSRKFKTSKINCQLFAGVE